ncbi:pyridoxamine 5'-phosphate oxidase [Zhengella mangrovi]|uniref:Pyridoxamine 5'-phosphate oxidase n=1 Tax=Zhengella mangrovi TaxID=1982044 RepID=A0A2G1QP46_9HYPH|nr:pyridoxamine 5'-phosphate oxidase family protein [Zhengella mangrovi]PHP67306.1 pyridoxamine 5'-phosphate oxidase [Zhengella mangrovi]
MTDQKRDPVRPADDESRQLVDRLVRTARHAALAVLDPETGGPAVSRVGLATAVDGTPLVLVSTLAAHTRGLLADGRCSLLVGEPGKGDPLAHPRVTLACRARRIRSPGEEEESARRRYLAANPKATLYAGFADFSFFALDLQSASLNGGFGRAYRLARDDLLCPPEAARAFAGAQQELLDWLNGRGATLLRAAAMAAGLETSSWTVTGIDPRGLDLARGSRTERLAFPESMHATDAVEKALRSMANG